MRTGQLRALIRELRDGGVSEFTGPYGKTGETVTIKLGATPLRAEDQPRRAPAKAAARAEAGDRRSFEAFLLQMGVTESAAREALGHVT